MKTIAMFNLSETTRDPRVRRIAGSLAARGHRVVVFNTDWEVKERHTAIDGFEIVRCDSGGFFAREGMRAFERHAAAAELLRGVSPEVFEHRWSPGARFVYRNLRRTSRVLAFAGRKVPLIDRAAESLAGDKVLFGLRSTMLTNLALFERALRYAPDVVHCNDLNTLLAGFLLKSARAIPLVYDAHEIYPEQFAEAQRAPQWHEFYTRLERALLAHTDLRMTVCDSIGRHFQEKYGSGPVLTIRNVPSLKLLPPEHVLARKNQPRRILYHGAYFAFRGIDEVIAAVPHLSSGTVVLRGFGQHEPVLRKLADDLGVKERVQFLPPVRVEQLVASAAEEDVGLCPFIPASLNTQYALPNKFFEYMMAGLALASSDLIEMRALTDQLGIGIMFRSLAPERMAHDLNALLADGERLDTLRRRAYTAAKNEYHWEQEEQRLFAGYREILG